MAKHRVVGWVHLDHLLEGRPLAAAVPAALEGHATRRREGPEVAERLEHVIEAAQRPEPQVGVPVGGGLVSQPGIDGVGVVVDREGIRVVDELTGRCLGAHERDLSEGFGCGSQPVASAPAEVAGFVASVPPAKA